MRPIAAEAALHDNQDPNFDDSGLAGTLRYSGVDTKCGNTSEPHLHFHLQNAPRFGAGDGLPAFFNDYIADGKPVARGEPVKGQVVRGK